MRSTAAILAAALLVSTIAATGCRHRNRETIDAHVVIDTTDAAETTGSPLDQIGGGQTSTLVESGGVLDYTEGPEGRCPSSRSAMRSPEARLRFKSEIRREAHKVHKAHKSSSKQG